MPQGHAKRPRRVRVLAAGFDPVPPWEQHGAPPPGIMLSPSVPATFTPFCSAPRAAPAPPYERLVLISSRVHQPMKVRLRPLGLLCALLPSRPRHRLQATASQPMHTPQLVAKHPQVAEAALPNVGVVVYDWKNFTLQELVLYVKKVVGAGAKVASIAVVAPGNTPGCICES